MKARNVEQLSFYGNADLPASLAAMYTRLDNAKLNAKNIPSWATWDEATAQAWGQTNIGQPITDAQTNLGLLTTLNLTTFKQAMIVILNILSSMWTMQWALARMVIAMRDQIWPDLPNNGTIKTP